MQNIRSGANKILDLAAKLDQQSWDFPFRALRNYADIRDDIYIQAVNGCLSNPDHICLFAQVITHTTRFWEVVVLEENGNYSIVRQYDTYPFVPHQALKIGIFEIPGSIYVLHMNIVRNAVTNIVIPTA